MKNLFFAFLVLLPSLAWGRFINFDVNAHSMWQTTTPMNGSVGGGIAAQFNFEPFIPHIHFDTDIYRIKFIDKDVTFKEYTYGVGAKYLFGQYFGMARFSRSSRFYNGVDDSAWRVGGALGRLVNRVEYSLGYYKFLKYDRAVLQFQISVIF